jgi:hypothetical protein
VNADAPSSKAVGIDAGGQAVFLDQAPGLELPPRLLEWGESENPEIEDEVETERAQAYHEMEGERLEKGESLLQPLQAMLAEKGVAVTIRLVQFAEPLDAKSVASAVLATAKEQGCGTVVVGRHSFLGWMRLLWRQVP